MAEPVNNCFSTELVYEDSRFNEVGVRRFVEEVNLAERYIDYAIVSIIGPQSSGKSTLLNHVFGTNFEVMNAREGRSQTTKGIWLAQSPTLGPRYLVIDVEGTDGRERGGDTTFEKRSALFALAISDVVILNMWCCNVGLTHGTYQPLLSILFQVMRKPFTQSKINLIFVLRDKTGTPLDKLKVLLQKDAQKIWNDIADPQDFANSALDDRFNIEVVGLSHYHYAEAEFKREVHVLKQLLEDTCTIGSVNPDWTPGSDFVDKAITIWDKIVENQDLDDLPTVIEKIAMARCDKISSVIHDSFLKNETWRQLEEDVRSSAVQDFENQVNELIGNSLSIYDNETSFYDETVRNQRRIQLKETLLQIVNPAYLSMREHTRRDSLQSFHEATEDDLNNSAGFSDVSRECIRSDLNNSAGFSGVSRGCIRSSLTGLDNQLQGLQPIFINRSLLPITRMGPFLPIEDIHPAMESWSAIVTVQEKRQPVVSITSPKKYQKLVFADAKGSQVEGILFDNAIDMMGTRLAVFKKYKISNAKVRPIDKKYQTGGLTVQWVISTKTVVEELPHDAAIISTAFSFNMFKDLAQFLVLDNQTVDVLAVVISIFPVMSFTNEFGPGKTQKFIIINEEKIPIQLSIFNKFIDNEGQQISDNMNNFPVVLCRRLKVKAFNGVSLSTRTDSIILVDPPLGQSEKLKKWATENTMLFAEIIEEKSYARHNSNLFVQSYPKFTPILYLEHSQKVGWIKVSMSFDNISQRYWYMACNTCYKATDASYGYIYSCNKCFKLQQASPRCRFDVTLADKSGSLTATLFGDQAEKILTYTALDAMHYFYKNVDLQLEHVHRALKTKQFAVQVQPAQSRYGDLHNRYTVLYYFEYVDAESSTQPTIEIPNSDFIVTPVQTMQLQTFENKSVSPNICINLASKFDEASSFDESNLHKYLESSKEKNAKKRKIS